MACNIKLIMIKKSSNHVSFNKNNKKESIKKLNNSLIMNNIFNI